MRLCAAERLWRRRGQRPFAHGTTLHQTIPFCLHRNYTIAYHPIPCYYVLKPYHMYTYIYIYIYIYMLIRIQYHYICYTKLYNIIKYTYYSMGAAFFRRRFAARASRASGLCTVMTSAWGARYTITSIVIIIMFTIIIIVLCIYIYIYIYRRVCAR